MYLYHPTRCRLRRLPRLLIELKNRSNLFIFVKSFSVSFAMPPRLNGHSSHVQRLLSATSSRYFPQAPSLSVLLHSFPVDGALRPQLLFDNRHVRSVGCVFPTFCLSASPFSLRWTSQAVDHPEANYRPDLLSYRSLISSLVFSASA